MNTIDRDLNADTNTPSGIRRQPTVPSNLEDYGSACHVPGVDLNLVLSKQPNGGVKVLESPLTVQSDADDIEMRDSSCQTRESLMQNRNSEQFTPPSFHNAERHTSTDSSDDYAPLRAQNVSYKMPLSPSMEEEEQESAGEEFFIPPCPAHGPQRIPAPPPPTMCPPPPPPAQRYRAEAVIEMKDRPRSFESTKSAPDVIVRH